MVGPKRSGAAIAFLLLTVLPLSACNNPTLQRAFSADPNTTRWGETDKVQTELPADFPTDLRYEAATLAAVNAPSNQVAGNAATGTPLWTRTRWTTAEAPQAILEFYRQRFGSNGWRLLRQVAGDAQISLTAQQRDLQVLVSIPVARTTPGAANPLSPATPQPVVDPNRDRPAPLTSFSLDYARGVNPEALSSAQEGETDLRSGDANLIGPRPPAEFDTASASAATASQQFTDLDQAEPELQPYIRDLAQLGVLTGNQTTSNSRFNPEQAIQRRTFARWLVEANNRIYRDRPARQIRLVRNNSQPAFRDVPATDPDFPYIQGLAEAGYLPSALSGDTSAVLFRPDAPLSRETMLQWKVPLDLRQILPTATVDSVKQAWGFKDANRIEPQALQAILADYQNGDLSNIRRIFGATLLLQPKKPVTQAQAAGALWYIGAQGDGFSAQDILRGEQQGRNAPPENLASPPLRQPQP